jgi:hypothetical protein
VVGIIGGVGHDDLGGKAFDKRPCLRHVAPMPCGQREADGATKASDREVDLGAQSATRSADGLIFRPPFLAPAAC